jgi:hypothetical protein
MQKSTEALKSEFTAWSVRKPALEYIPAANAIMNKNAVTEKNQSTFREQHYFLTHSNTIHGS